MDTFLRPKHVPAHGPHHYEIARRWDVALGALASRNVGVKATFHGNGRGESIEPGTALNHLVGVRRACYVAYVADAPRIDALIWSYSTVIAWHTPDGWTVPDERYSVTTSRLQSALRTAARTVMA